MKKSPIKFAAIGECMLELRHLNEHSLTMGFAGDTFNVALYLARYSNKLNLKVTYVTALSDDSYSNMMLQAWQQEGINTKLVQILPNMLPGLYLIRTDGHGERSFYFYRSQSAARQIFYAPKIEAVKKSLLQYDHLYFSGIALAILDTKSRQSLLSLLNRARNLGAKISFDTNYRPILWKKQSIAQAAIKSALQLTDTALVTFDDEKKLFGDKNPKQSIKRLHSWGVKEVVVKVGGKGCFISMSSGEPILIAAQKVSHIVDTTAAGDSFNAAYLAGRMKGMSPIKAAKLAHQLAAKVIQYSGAIIPRKIMPKLF